MTESVERETLRLPLSVFAREMEAKLREHDVDRGALGWRESAWDELLDGLKREVRELETEMRCVGTASEELAVQKYESIMKESADVANFAMFIHDKCREALKNMLENANRALQVKG